MRVKELILGVRGRLGRIRWLHPRSQGMRIVLLITLIVLATGAAITTGRMYTKQRLAEVEGAEDSAVLTEESNANLAIRDANEALGKDNTTAAIAILQAEISRGHSGDVLFELHHELGRIYQTVDDHRFALSEYERALSSAETSETRARGYLALAQTADRLEEYERALLGYQAYLNLVEEEEFEVETTVLESIKAAITRLEELAE